MFRLTLLAAGASAALVASTAVAGAATPRYDVTVTRTQFGIPHINAGDYASLGYGYAHALAEDDICTVAESYLTSGGERSRFFGAEKSYAIRGNGSTANNLNSDFFYQRMRDRKEVERLVAVPPPLGPKPQIKQALGGYVAGYNAYLHEIGGSDGVPDPTCRGKAWVRPITIMDVYRRFYSLAILASQGVALDGIGAAQPPTPSLTQPATRAGAEAEALAAAAAIPPGEIDRRLGGLGSNAYAIGRSLSRDGHGLLYGNPHFPWQGPERFYQSHLTIPGKLDVTGGSLMGVPIVLIGATKGMAWSHTVSTARRFVPYQLTLVPGSPTAYVQDGVVKHLRAETVTVQVKGAGGAVQSRTRTLYSSEHGSILTSILGLPIFPWSPATAYAMYDGNAENFGRLLNHFFDMNSAQSVDEVDRILKRYEGIPWVNTIAADTAGNAYYADIGSIPNVDRAKYAACQTALGQATDLAQRIPVLDGSRAACDSGVAQDAVAPGILGLKDLPSLRRTDHVSNMNDSYWLTNPAAPLEGFSRIIGDERTARSLRTRLGIRQLQQRADGTDGLPGKGFTLANLMTVGLSNRVYSGELWRDDLVAGCTSAACDVLRAWDLHNDLDSQGAILWQRFVTRLTGAAPLPLPGPLGPFAGSFDVRDPVNTPAGLNRINPMVASALAQAQADLKGAGLPLDAAPRQAQTVTRRGEVIPIHGGPGGSGIFNVVTPTWDPKRGYTEVVHGSSFVQAVHLTPGCPEIRTLLTYGESDNPASVHSSDLTKEFSAKRWVNVPFCPAALERDRSAVRTHTADLGTTVVTVGEARGKARPRITVTRTAGKPARITVRIRRGGRIVRRITRRAARVVVAPKVARGVYRVDVSFGTRTVRVPARQR